METDRGKIGLILIIETNSALPAWAGGGYHLCDLSLILFVNLAICRFAIIIVYNLSGLFRWARQKKNGRMEERSE